MINQTLMRAQPCQLNFQNLNYLLTNICEQRVPLKTLRDIIDCSVHIPVYLGDDKLTLDIEGNKSVHIKGSGPWKVISGYNYSQPWEVEYKSLKKSA